MLSVTFIMYRLTIACDVARPNQPSTWIRVYRWGNKWGTLRLGCKDFDRSWNVESRTQLYSDPTHVLESVREYEQTPPPDVDDIWEEEIVEDTNITYGNLLVITGNSEQILNTCKKLQITLSNKIQSAISTPSQEFPSSPQAPQAHRVQGQQGQQVQQGQQAHRVPQVQKAHRAQGPQAQKVPQVQKAHRAQGQNSHLSVRQSQGPLFVED